MKRFQHLPRTGDPDTRLLTARALCFGVIAATMATVGGGPAAAATEPGPWDYSVGATTLQTPEVDLDAGGEIRVTSHHLRAGADRQVGESSELGVRVSYDFFDREFSGADAFGPLQNLGNTNDFGIAGSMTSQTRFGWSYGVRPFVDWSFESGAFSEDAMRYGAAVAVVAGLSGDQRIGLGAQLARDMEDETKVSPIIIVHWEVNDRWTIANPREANFTSPAGVEVRYRSGEDWWIALAGIYHSDEYRLDDRGVAAGGIGESSGIFAYLRATHRWRPWLRINGYIGAIFNAELEVEDVDGNQVAASGYDTAPFAALALEGRF